MYICLYRQVCQRGTVFVHRSTDVKAYARKPAAIQHETKDETETVMPRHTSPNIDPAHTCEHTHTHAHTHTHTRLEPTPQQVGGGGTLGAGAREVLVLNPCEWKGKRYVRIPPEERVLPLPSVASNPNNERKNPRKTHTQSFIVAGAL